VKKGQKTTLTRKSTLFQFPAPSYTAPTMFFGSFPLTLAGPRGGKASARVGPKTRITFLEEITEKKCAQTSRSATAIKGIAIREKSKGQRA
jgi:hypothetical protein